MRLKYCLFMSYLLMSCNIENDDVENSISYIQDSKTDLCFAKGMLLVNLNVKYVFTNVPCTEKVLAQINGSPHE